MFGNTALLSIACVLVVAATQGQAGYVGSPVEGRVKRQAPAQPPPGPPPMWRQLMGCCQIPMIIKRDSRLGCMPSAPTTPVVPMAGQPKNCGNHTCVIECAYRAQGLLNTATNKVDETKLTARVNELVTANPAWATILPAALTTCIPTIANGTLSSTPCKSGAGEVTACINNKLYQNCPTGVKNTSATCADLLANAGKNMRSG